MSLLWWAIIALVVSVIAGALGFGGVSAGAATIAKLLFGIFLVIFLLLIILVIAGVNVVAT